jgi:hypothetical protein
MAAGNLRAALLYAADGPQRVEVFSPGERGLLKKEGFGNGHIQMQRLWIDD